MVFCQIDVISELKYENSEQRIYTLADKNAIHINMQQYTCTESVDDEEVYAHTNVDKSI